MAKKRKRTRIDDEITPQGVTLAPQHIPTLGNNSNGDISKLFGSDIPDFAVYSIWLKELKDGEKFSRGYMNYPEVYGIIGKVQIELEYAEINQKREYKLRTGYRIYMPRRTLVRINALEYSLLIILSGGISKNGKCNGKH